MTVRVRPWKRKSGKAVPGEWEVDIFGFLPGRKPYRERTKAPVTSKTGAKQWGLAREHEILAAAAAAPPGSSKPKENPTLHDFWDRFIEGHCTSNKHKPSGINAKRYAFRAYLDPLLGHRRLHEISNEDIAHLKAKFVEHSPSTMNNILSVLSMVLKVATEWEVTDPISCRIRLVKVPDTVPKFYDFEQYDRLLVAARAVDPRIYAMVLLGGDAGLRRGEMVALDRSSLNFSQSLITIDKAEWRGQINATKGMESRVVPMTTRLRAALNAIRHLRGDRVFYTDDGEPITAKIQQKWMVRVQRKAGLRDSGEIHILRHTFCSHLAMRGAPALAIQKLAGHKSLQTTMGYMHLSSGEAQRAIRLLESSHRERSDELSEPIHRCCAARRSKWLDRCRGRKRPGSLTCSMATGWAVSGTY